MLDRLLPFFDSGASSGPEVSRRTSTIVLIAILAAALALRLYGLNWDEGFAWTPHPDERAILFKVIEIELPTLSDLPVLLDAEQSPWNPGWFPYGSFPLYLIKLVDILFSDLPVIGFEDLRVPARAVSALADVLTILVTYLVGRAIRSRITGLLAAGLVAFSVIHIQLSHFFAVDTLMALLATATLYFLLRVARWGRYSDSALAGLCIGLALATKISVAPILAAYVVAHVIYVTGLVPGVMGRNIAFFDRLSAGAKSGLLGLGVMVCALLLAQPYALLDWRQFYGDFVEQSEMVRRIRDYPYTRQYIDTTPYLYHVQQLAVWGLGLPLGIVALAGTLYAAVKGLRAWYAVPYLLVGTVLPAGVLILSSSVVATLIASAIAVGAIIATIPVRSLDTRLNAVLLSWAIPYFLIVGAFDVKFMRYMLPITPVLVLFGSGMVADLWSWAKDRQSAVKVALAVTTTLAGAATVFFAVSYSGIYSETHPAVRASEWIQANAPRGSTILKEHWEEGLPGLYEYEVEELPIYDYDLPQKFSRMSDLLAESDYIALYSNRLYGTVSRLPDRYPVSREYYRQLFSGELGYELSRYFTSYPNLLGVGFVDETFARPDLPPPGRLSEARPYPVSINLGYADESFSVYDHPKVLVFRNVGRLSADEILRRIEEGSGGYPAVDPIAHWEPDPTGRQLMLTPEEAADRQAGGTWSDIIDGDGDVGPASALLWFVVVQLIALSSAPLAFIVFRPLADRGWLMCKALGLLTVGLVTWLLASLEVLTFTRSTVIVALVAVAIVNAVLLFAIRREIIQFFRRRWRTIAIAELIFLAAFLAFVAIRMANPDLWHPYRGGEKPMDMAYLNAVLKSVYMPPYDPWFAGGYLNYYYWGQFLVSTLIHLTGIVPEVAVNLAIPTFFAMTAALSYSVVYNLASWVRMSRRESAGLSPVVAGLIGLAFVTVIGNLDGAIQVVQFAWKGLVQGLPVGDFDFWRSSRMMPPDPPGHEITEFPFFTFLFADPHAHLWVLPFTLLCIGLSASIVFGLVGAGSLRDVWRPGHLLTLVVLGVSVGALRLLNTWDYPTYLLFGFASVGLAEYLAQGGMSGGVIFRTATKSALVLAVGVAAYLPFYMTNETFFIGIERTTNQTTLWQFLAIFGLFAYVIGSYCLWELRGALSSAWSAVLRGSASFSRALAGDAVPGSASGLSLHIGPALVLTVVSGALLLGFLLTSLLTGSGWGTVFFAGTLLTLTAVSGLKAVTGRSEETPVVAFVALVVATALAIVIGLDFVRVEGDIERMNSVFKFYMQVWVLLALGSAYLVWRMLGSSCRLPANRSKLRLAWFGGLVVLVSCATVFTALGTQDRLRDRFDTERVPLTLDGLAYVPGATYLDREGPIDLEADLEGVRWLRENAQGSPVVLEANTPLYRWGGRVSIHTGLPSVVGWRWHQQQQRWGYRDQVDRRIRDVDRIYSTPSASEAIDLLNQYGVKYVYVGQVERLYYPEHGIAKFRDELGPHLTPVFRTEDVTIYEFRG